MTTRTAVLAPTAAQPVGLKVAAALAGTIAVAAAAQVALPLPGTPVPMTFQPLAVLVVGGLLGARYGALSLAMYLVIGAAGLPVFTPGGAPGLARLFGTTGGYLLAYPVAAAVVGWTVGRSVGRYGGKAVGVSGADAAVGTRTALPPYRLTALAAFLGMLTIHAGGMAQLAVLTGSARAAVALGSVPFVAGDLVKIVVAALLLRRFASATRALR